MNHLLDHLNPPQLAAVTLPPAHALILAGAGSGKTRVLTTRIAWLISTGQVSPPGILAVTFTNKAAKEMQTRLAGMLPINVRGMWIGTFHGLCNRLLRAHHRDAGLPALFQILDSADQQASVKRLLKALNVDDEKFPPRELCHFINAQKEQGLRAAAVEAAFGYMDDWARKRVGLYEAYEAQCQREGVVDFAELLLRSYELLERNEPLRRHYQERFRHILVDEFQDTNKLQYKWLKLLAGGAPSAAAGPSQGGAAFRTEPRSGEPPSPPPAGRGAEAGFREAPLRTAEAGRQCNAGRGTGGGLLGACIFAVGDDDQSIYAFRGADVGNMADFEREFKVQNLIRLEQNYRSHGNILDAANAIIKNNPSRLGKNLWTEAGSGEPVRIYESYSDGDEARWIAEEVKALQRDGHTRAEIALLYRSNAQSRALEHALFNAGLPYRVYGGLRFFERAEIKHALAYLRLIANTDDDTAFARVVNFPARGIGARSLENLQDAAKAANSSLHAAIPQVAGAGGARLAAFAQLIVTLRDAAHLPLPELVDHVLELSGLRAHYQNDRDGQERLDNLDELINAAASFVAEEGQANQDGEITGEFGNDLSSFLAHASLEAGEHQAGEGDDALQLMTVHSAKGLEFNVVFISGLEDGLFPHENAVSPRFGGHLPAQQVGGGQSSLTEDKGLEEERRLMYVAVTRARQRLYLSFAQTRMLHGQTRYNLPSRFLDEVPAELVKWLTPRAGAGGFAAQDSANRSYGSPGTSSSGATPRRAESSGSSGFRIGQSVMHAKFGLGVIINAEGGGTDARVQVNFGAAGIKWLALSIAKLEAA